jgi:beta-galactosidase
MKPHFIIVALAALLLWPSIDRAGDIRTTLPFDSGWRFLNTDSSGAEQPQFDDAPWTQINVPHDWSIAGSFAETNLTGGAGGFLPSGIGWYRKHFSLPEKDKGRCVFIDFDGVMANSDVWINGFHLGHRPYGYVSFSYELTGHLNFGGDNVLAVRADTSQQPASRWYTGAGIYRHVRLVETSPVHIEQDGVFISTPSVSTNIATITVQLSVTNESTADRKVTVEVQLISSHGEAFSECLGSAEIAAGGTEKKSLQMSCLEPRLWNLDSPNLYRVVSKVFANGQIIDEHILDEVTNTFGIREFHFDAATGFWLNGRNFKIKGVAIHADGGAFGAAIPLSVWEQRLKTLKSLGVNAIRTAHNPPAPDFLDLCDRMGFLVMDEFFDCWTVGKQGLNRHPLADYHLYFNEWSHTDERDTIRRDRNHPSIILYSVGNEIHDTPQQEKAKKILAGLVAVAHETDPTRPVTQALFRPNASHDYDDGLADMLDVIGQNYRENEILAAHAQKPSRKIIGTENRQDRATWLALRDNPPYAGQFLWSGIDYLGESFRWPLVGHNSGLLDRTGAPRATAFERQSWWSDQPMVHMVRRVAPTDAMPADPGYAADERYTQVLFTDWTPKNLNAHQENVEVYSNCKDVELFLNGKSLGVQEIHADASPRIWNVAFAPGELKAVARNNGKVVAIDELTNAGKPSKIILTTNLKKIADNWDAVAFVRAEIVDGQGTLVPHANNLVSFQVSGPGVIAAVDNADNSSHDPFQTNQRHAFQGKCIAFVKANSSSGKIIITASSPGLKSDSVRIRASK